MKVPLEVAFKDVPKTDRLEELIDEQVGKLEQVCDHINSCRLAVERPQKHQRAGNPYRVRVDLTVSPGHEIVVRKEPGEGDLHQTLDQRVRNTFQAARRKLRRLAERQRREVKSHPDQVAGAIVDKLFVDEGYGFLKTLEGREVYFHRNSVINDDFDRLEIGTAVRIVEELGEKGPQASTVQIVDKPGSRVSGADEDEPADGTADEEQGS